MNTTNCHSYTLMHGIAFSLAVREQDIAASITKSLRCLENMVELKKLIREYETEHLGSKDQSDEEYLSKFDDIE